MATAPPALQALAQTGIDALRRGDAGGALTVFREIEAQGGEPPWLAVARACNLLGDPDGEERALQRILDNDKRDLPALLAMGDLHARRQDDRAAGAFFRAALNQAALAPPPAALHPLLERAQSFLAEAARRYETHLEEKLAASGLAEAMPARASPSPSICCSAAGSSICSSPTSSISPACRSANIMSATNFPGWPGSRRPRRRCATNLPR